MRLSAIARRYAGALFQAARDADAVDRVESDLGLVTYTAEANPSLREVFLHPVVPPDRKKEIVAEIFQAKIEDLTLRFLYLLIDKRREEILEEVEREYVRLANDYRGVIPAMVTTAVPLTADEKSRLAAKLGEWLGKKVELHLSEDQSLIGGVLVRIEDTVIDGSVRGYLEVLRDKLLGRE